MAEVSNPHTDQVWPESRWRQAGRKFFATGVLAGDDNELAPSDGGALDVAVDTGRAFVDGEQYVNTTSTTVTLDAADPSNDRIDLVVVEYDPDGAAAGEGTVRLDKVTGTPASSPTAPTPTQSDAGIYQYVLAEVTVPAGSSSLGNIDDKRDLIDVPGWDHSTPPVDGEMWRFDADTGFFVPTGGLVRVAETTLSAAAATVTFESIPQIYDDLQLKIWASVDAAEAGPAIVQMTFNNDTAANYPNQLLDVDGTTVSGSRSTLANVQVGRLPNTADERGGLLADIFGYADADHDTSVYTRGANHEAEPELEFISARWNNNAAVTEIDLVLDGGENFDAGSEFVLYGRL